ncbi:MAG: hypothetical protein ACR2M8_12260 [Pyrinomonadaceae bacterium]|nr:hypothetical protein [Blastocatellia bacterium]MDQ3490828.1 LMBR1 domain-containing protein [Acidobacteriota bacterium]
MGLKDFGLHRILIVALAFLAVLVSVGDLNAQTRRKRKSQSAPSVSSPPPSSEPLIISRAEDFPDSETMIVPANQEEKNATASESKDRNTITMEDLGNRIKNLEAGSKRDSDEKQKRLLLNLDILTRSEQRAETLRKQLFEMIEKESAIKTKLDLIENDIRPEAIEKSVAFAGSLRPEELRNMRRKNLEIEKTNLQSLLTEIQRTKANLDQNVQRADILVDKLRNKLEKEIDDALVDDPEKN